MCGQRDSYGAHQVVMFLDNRFNNMYTWENNTQDKLTNRFHSNCRQHFPEFHQILMTDLICDGCIYNIRNGWCFQASSLMMTLLCEKLIQWKHLPPTADETTYLLKQITKDYLKPQMQPWSDFIEKHDLEYKEIPEKHLKTFDKVTNTDRYKNGAIIKWLNEIVQQLKDNIRYHRNSFEEVTYAQNMPFHEKKK